MTQQAISPSASPAGDAMTAHGPRSSLDPRISRTKSSFQNPPSNSLFKANQLPRHAEWPLRYDALCIGRSLPQSTDERR
jgi:hypothetical protein